MFFLHCIFISCIIIHIVNVFDYFTTFYLHDLTHFTKRTNHKDQVTVVEYGLVLVDFVFFKSLMNDGMINVMSALGGVLELCDCGPAA